MNVETPNEIANEIMSIREGEEKYDYALKQLLSNREFLVRILKRFVKELAPYSLEEIDKEYLEHEEPLISKVGVEKNTTNQIEGLNVEDKSNNEGNISYVILFKVRYPGEEADEEIADIGFKSLLDDEGNDTDEIVDADGYSIIKRFKDEDELLEAVEDYAECAEAEPNGDAYNIESYIVDGKQYSLDIEVYDNRESEDDSTGFIIRYMLTNDDDMELVFADYDSTDDFSTESLAAKIKELIRNRRENLLDDVKAA